MASSNLQIDNGVVKDDLNCVKCKSILKDACLVPCGCRLCRVCINDLMASGVEFCPGLSEECGGSPLSRFVTDYRANRNISKLPIKCPNNGCVHTCLLANMDEHLRVCPRKSVECPFRELGCTQDKMAAEDMSSHLQRESLSHSELLIGMINNINNEMEGSKRDIDVLEIKTNVNNLEKTCESNNRKIDMLMKTVENYKKEIEVLKESEKRNMSDIKMRRENVIKALKKIDEDNKKEIEVLKKDDEDNKKEIEVLKKADEDNKKEIEMLKETEKRNMNDIKMLRKSMIEVLKKAVENNKKDIELSKENDESTMKEIEVQKEAHERNMTQIQQRRHQDLVNNESKSEKEDVPSIKCIRCIKSNQCTECIKSLLEKTRSEIYGSHESSNAKIIDYVDKEVNALKEDVQSINQGTQLIKADIDSIKSQMELLQAPETQVDARHEWLIDNVIRKESLYFHGATYPYKYQLASCRNKTNLIRIYLRIWSEEREDNLLWPFRGTVTITVSNPDKPTSCLTETRLCQMNKPLILRYKHSGVFEFLYAELIEAGVDINDDLWVTCTIAPILDNLHLRGPK